MQLRFGARGRSTTDWSQHAALAELGHLARLIRGINGYGMVACGRAKRTLGCGNHSVRRMRNAQSSSEDLTGRATSRSDGTRLYSKAPTAQRAFEAADLPGWC